MTFTPTLILLFATTILLESEASAVPSKEVYWNARQENSSFTELSAARTSTENCVPKVPLSFSKATAYGGSGGAHFDDTTKLRYDETLKSIQIRSGARIDRISFSTKYATYNHGGNGGSSSKLSIYPGEKITSVKVCTGVHNSQRVFFLGFTLNTGYTFAKGQTTSTCRTIYIPKDKEIVAGYGRAASELDRIGFIVRPPMCKV